MPSPDRSIQFTLVREASSLRLPLSLIVDETITVTSKTVCNNNQRNNEQSPSLSHFLLADLSLDLRGGVLAERGVLGVFGAASLGVTPLGVAAFTGAGVAGLQWLQLEPR